MQITNSETGKYPILDGINYPSDVKKLTIDKLPALCDDVRRFIIDTLSQHPGHFAAGLGVVELTVALHYIYNTPYDQIVFDVGHQAYPHKILTGRKNIFSTLRSFHGMSPFPNRDESEYDAFTVGHASTSISSALGLAVASEKLGRHNQHVIAVIGDGAMTGGMAFEALNNAGIQKNNLLVILNDNHMAIDPNRGALNDYLLDITTSKTYNRVKNDVWNALGKFNRLVPSARQFIAKVENGIKYVVMKRSNLFEGLGLRYFGPVDGHDVVHLAQLLADLKNIPGPKLLHINTIKGKGYKFAEENQTKWHATSTAFDIDTGKTVKNSSAKPQGPKYQDVFGKTVTELATKNSKIVGVTPAMPTGCSLNIMAEKFPDRVYDVGIAEEHAVTFSAGMAAQGLVPYCNIYSSFMQRAYDQIIHDVCLPRLPVILCLDRAGLVGADGATHQGAFDISYLRHIPNLTCAAPMDEIDLRNMLYTAQLGGKGPFSIRYPRGNGFNPDWEKTFEEIEVGKGRQISDGEDIAIISIGTIGHEVELALQQLHSDKIYPAHFDMRFIKPLDTTLLDSIFAKYKRIVTVEDNVLQGGFGSAICEYACDHFYNLKIKRLGIPDRFIEHGSPEDLYKVCGIDSGAIALAVKEMIKN
ncbi:MAG: 1-deoxy-D-xylulose-5-phosphate synthase [Bacteroidales bacterium]|nr:1-deoxy-D-xylulose-5-phosphate synthase [Bacteroidales bacterium]